MKVFAIFVDEIRLPPSFAHMPSDVGAYEKKYDKGKKDEDVFSGD